MKYLFKNTVMAFVFLGSSFAFADGRDTVTGSFATDENKPTQPDGFDPERAQTAFNRLKDKLSVCSIDTSADIKKIQENINQYKKNQKDCASSEDKANTFCMESRNPDVKTYLNYSQLALGAVSTMGITDACNTFGKVMDAGNKMLSTYMTACGSWRGYCTSTCKAAVKNVESAKANAKVWIDNVETKASAKASNPQDPEQQTCAQLAKTFRSAAEEASKSVLDPELQADVEDKTSYKAVAKKLKSCDDYKFQLASAGVGLLGMVKSFGEANKCSKNSGVVDCTIAANKQNNMTCICQDAPRTKGCAGLDSTVSAASGDSLRTAASSAGEYVPYKASGNVDSGGGGETPLSSKADPSGASAPGAPTSGGGPGIDGGSGGAGGAGGVAQASGKASSLGTNILGGEGSGGGGSWGGSGSGSESRGGGLRQYLPGGAKDPTALAGQAAVTKEVTSQGGKSNWEKVRERYRDNKPSLLGY